MPSPLLRNRSRKVAIATWTYAEPADDAIITAIEMYSDKLNLPAEIYRLGAEAFQGEIDRTAYPELIDISGRYNKMAGWYWRANERSKAVLAQRKAIDVLKAQKGFSGIKLAAFELRLHRYKNMLAKEP